MVLSSPFYFLSSASLITSTLMVLSSTNWLFLWIALELNLLSFIPLMMYSNSYQETEATVKYFLMQALGSSLMLMSSMSMWFVSTIPMNFMTSILLMSMVLKIGMAPCHMWYASVMTSISWKSAFVLSTWQKIAPLFIMSLILTNSSSKLMMLIACLNALIGGIMGLNQSHFRTILAYSSVTHMGWMMALISLNKPYFTIIYFILYIHIVSPLFIIMIYNASLHSNSHISSAMEDEYPKHWWSRYFPIFLLSLGGLPPLTGFIPKWVTIYIIADYSPLMLMILITGSMLNLYYYLNIVFAMMLSTRASRRSEKKLYHNKLAGSYKYFMKTSGALTFFLFLAPYFFIIYYALILFY